MLTSSSRTQRPAWSWLDAALLSMLLAGCGGGSGGGSSPSPPPIDSTPPSVPQAVTATTESPTRLRVNWQASTDTGTGVAGYRVFRDDGSTPVATVTDTSYADDNLAPATAYAYRVRAFDRATPPNESALSTVASATTRSLDAGLDARPDNSSCIARDRPSVGVTLATERIFPGLPGFANPVLMLQAPGDSSHWFVVEQGGRVRAFANQPGVTATRVVVDIAARVRSGGEMGLLGMAFHPGFPGDPRVYLSYTNDASGLVSRVSEFRTRDGGQTLDSASEQVLLTVAQPANNHNGGNIAFGPDGNLYIGFGDGGGGGDPWGTIGNGQDLRTTLGKFLRIDIGGATGSVPYRIPADNPFAGNGLCNTGAGATNCPEILAYGFRNPWRWSFDRQGGDLWVADVGQGQFEEVNRVVTGGNYGWRCFEGTNPYNATCGPNGASSRPPIAQYGRSAGQSITGGFVYRGNAIPALVGRYVFGDFVTGRIWHIAHDTPPTLTVAAGFDSSLSIASFAEDTAGELYVVNYGGTLHRLLSGAATGDTVASLLSATGCVLPGDATRPATGLVPHAPNAAAWSDGATIQRHLALPNGTSMRAAGDDDFELPTGSVLMQDFWLAGLRVETRLLMRHSDGDWAGYTYEWNAQGTDATRVVGGKTVRKGAQDWVIPSEAQCLACHTAAAGRSLGLDVAQLNRDQSYPQTGRTANQIVTLNAVQILDPPVTTPPTGLPALADPYGSTGSLNSRARAYLHANCAHCHRPGGGTPFDLDLRHTTSLVNMNGCDRPPQSGDLGIGNARIIAAGDAARSVLVARMDRRDGSAMPPLASTLVDATGVGLVAEWIDSLDACP